jgi:hypothetical protein
MGLDYHFLQPDYLSKLVFEAGTSKTIIMATKNARTACRDSPEFRSRSNKEFFIDPEVKMIRLVSTRSLQVNFLNLNSIV